MRPYFEKMQEWNKPVKVNAKNAEEIKAVEKDIEERVLKARNAGLAQETLNKRGEWTVHQRLEYIVDPVHGPRFTCCSIPWTKSRGQPASWTVSAG